MHSPSVSFAAVLLKLRFQPDVTSRAGGRRGNLGDARAARICSADRWKRSAGTFKRLFEYFQALRPTFTPHWVRVIGMCRPGASTAHRFPAATPLREGSAPLAWPVRDTLEPALNCKENWTGKSGTGESEAEESEPGQGDMMQTG